VATESDLAIRDYARSGEYLGTKRASGVHQVIIARMPPHDTYIETHFGTGTIMRLKPQAERSIAIEIDPETLAAFPPPDFAEVHNGSCIDFLERFDFAGAGRVLIYADPPYLMSTRTSRHRYRCDYDEADHRALIALLRAVPAAVILSGYPSALYAELLADWRTHSFQGMTRRGPRTEQIWMNYQAGALHWASFAGRNWKERQRIKRKAERWAANYRALPPAERLAILAAILGEGRPCSLAAGDYARAISARSVDHSRARLCAIAHSRIRLGLPASRSAELVGYD
jgi:DNA adenine methylase